MGTTTRLVTASMSARFLSGFDSVSSTSLANFYIVCSHMFSVWMFLTLELSMTYFDLKSTCNDIMTVISQYNEAANDEY